MAQKTQKARFWAILAFINVVAILYPLNLYIQATTNDTQLFAAIALLGTGFLLLITDAVSAIVAYMR